MQTQQHIKTVQSLAYTITAVSKQGDVETITINENVPDFLHCFDKQWSGLFINKVDTTPQIFGINAYEPKAEKMQTMLCTATGIYFNIDVPAIIGLQKLEFTSPLANYMNCIRIVKAHILKGIPLHKALTAEYLAGIFITIAQDKGLLKIKDIPLANKYLQTASPILLADAINLLASLNTTVGLPSISLLNVALAQQNHWRDTAIKDSANKNNADLTLLHWLDAVKTARNDRNKPAYDASTSGRNAIPAKVITNPAKRQDKENATIKADMRKQLKAITIKYAISEHAAFLADLAFTVRMAEYSNPEKLKAAAAELEKRFNLDLNAMSLASCLRSVKINEIEKDLQGIIEPPTVKKGFDLLAIVARKTGKEV